MPDRAGDEFKPSKRCGRIRLLGGHGVPPDGIEINRG